ncbi:MAG: hypothetical protein ACRDZX_14565, partial [Acidimicrobiales bacterium]
VQVPALSKDARVVTMAAAADGGLLLGGSDGRHELVGRLLADGRVDKSFAGSGWARLRRPESGPTLPISGPSATSLAEGAAGTVYVGGNNGSAHCCVEDFVAALTGHGRLERSFGAGGWARLARFDGSYTTDVFVDGKGLLVMGLVMFTGCGGPLFARLGSSGARQAGAGATIGRSLASLSPGWSWYPVPALFPRPGGGFALAGDLITSGCKALPAGPARYRGLAVGLSADGNVDRSFGTDGRTQLPPSHAAAVWAVPARGGATMVVAEPAPTRPSFRPKALEVRELSAQGRYERGLGHAGTLTLDLPVISGTAPYQVSVVPAPRGAVVVAAGSPKGVELLTVRPPGP